MQKKKKVKITKEAVSTDQEAVEEFPWAIKIIVEKEYLSRFLV